MAEKTPAIAAPPSIIVQNVPVPPPPVIVQGKSSYSKIALIVIAVLVGGGGVWFIQERGHADVVANTAAESPNLVIHLDGFTVNLADPEENHFLRVTMELAIQHMPAPVDREKPNSGLPTAKIRDTILSILTAGKADALLTSEGKQQLKKSLLDALNRETPELGVREIYFTEFLVQR